MMTPVKPAKARPAWARSRSGSAPSAICTSSMVNCVLAIDAIAVATLTGQATSSPILPPVLFAWLGANLLLWRYGWRLLEGSQPASGDDLLPDRNAAAP